MKGKNATYSISSLKGPQSQQKPRFDTQIHIEIQSVHLETGIRKLWLPTLGHVMHVKMLFELMLSNFQLVPNLKFLQPFSIFMYVMWMLKI